MWKSIAILSLSIAAFVNDIDGRSTNTRPPYVECQSNLECTPGHCCTIGPNKFSIPQCKAMQDYGEVCRPNGRETLNRTLYYPDGSEVKLTDVHYIICPCIDGFSCDKREGICRDASQQRGFNNLLGEASRQDD